MARRAHKRPTRAVNNLARRERRATASKRSDEAAEQSPPQPTGLERLFRIDEIALMGGPKRAKLYQHVKTGLLPTVKIGTLRRVTESGYRRYLEALAAQPTA